MKIKTFAFAVGAFLVVAMSSRVASAAARYVCNVSYSPAPGQFGAEGYINASLYSGTNCSGTFVGSYYSIKTDMASTTCASGAGSCPAFPIFHRLP